MSRDTTLPTGAVTAAIAPSYVARHAVRIATPTPLLLCEGPGSLVIGGETYFESALVIGDVSVAQWPAITIRVPNNTNQISEPDTNGDYVRRAAVLVYEVMWNPTTGSQLNPVQVFSGKVGSVRCSMTTAELTCKTAATGSAGMVGRVVSRLCGYVFKGARCAYGGVITSCDHTLATCTTLANQTRFGGWPTMPTIGTKFCYRLQQQQPFAQRAGTIAPSAPLAIPPAPTAPTNLPRVRRHIGR